MRKTGSLKLNQFSKAEMDRRKLDALKGGCNCYCPSDCPCSCSGTIDEAGTIAINDAIDTSQHGYDMDQDPFIY